MAITLYRFPISHFSEKGRALLDYKQLDYRIVELKLGLPQLRIVRMTGQRRVPVIDHDGRLVHDSTEIALYLERTFPDRRPLLPKDEARRKEALDLEDRIDRGLGLNVVMAWLRHQAYRPEVVRLLDVEVAGAGTLGARALAALTRRAEKGFARERVDEAERKVRAVLEELSDRLARSKYLLGDEPTMADLAAVGLTLHLEFPHSKYFPFPELAGQGVPAFTDDPKLSRFFDWRRRFYADYLK